MASFSMESYEKQQLTTVTVTGQLQPDELCKYVQRHEYGARHLKTLWDMRNASCPNMPAQSMISSLARITPFTRDGQKTAFVFGTDLDYGLCRMVEPHFKQYKFKSRIWPFKDIEKAVQWLNSDIAEDESEEAFNELTRSMLHKYKDS